MKELRKYKIDEMMNKLNLPKYKAALKIIPKTLGIAFNTFHNYRKLKVGDKSDIPYGQVRKLEIRLKIRPSKTNPTKKQYCFTVFPQKISSKKTLFIF